MTQACPNVLMIQPNFVGGSFWNYRTTCEAIGARYPAPPLGLITIAAMLPDDWPVRLVDCNVSELTDGDIAWADLVMTGGMLPQQFDILAVVARCQAAGVPVAVGGPDITSSPHLYEAADFRVLGEAEGVIGDLIAAWLRGDRTGTFEAEKFTADVTTTPIPRFDLLDFSHYLQVGVQFSRGCPFLCEFCDIIELYGRKPRTKNTHQMLAELDRLYELGYRGHVDFVDDNLIGNKKAVKAFLPELIAWQKAHKFPFEFSTEASLNLADDRQFLSLMRDAGFFAVFIGIESPDPEVLAQTRKKQNTRRDITESVNIIYEYGLFVLAGFIVGFDTEPKGTDKPMIALIEEAAIPVCMVGLMYALPNTQLTRRLEREGRLHIGGDVVIENDDGDQCTSGLNFDTLRPKSEILSEYRSVVQAIYSPASYFARVAEVGRRLKIPGALGALNPAFIGKDLAHFARLGWWVTRHAPQMRGPFWKAIVRTAFANPAAVKPVLSMAALYIHLGPFSNDVIRDIGTRIAEERKAAPAGPAKAAQAA